jgi:hypothetical protein
MGKKIIHIRFKGVFVSYLNNFSIFNVETYSIERDTINRITVLKVTTNKHNKVYHFNTSEILEIKCYEKRDDIVNE